MSNEITRREMLGIGGAGLAAAAIGAAPIVGKSQTGSLRRAPNIVVLMTDQERAVMHWPPGWAEKNLPSLQRLRRHGLSFERAFTAACQCSPSRSDDDRTICTGQSRHTDADVARLAIDSLPAQRRVAAQR
jgi:hypothetical protein